MSAILRPDRNRHGLESIVSRQMADGIIPDSILGLDYNPWQNGETPRVLLIVPPYTRIKRPLDVVMQNLEREENDVYHLEHDREIASTLRNAGINFLEEMKRSGVPMGLLRVGTAAKRSGYDVRILDAVFEGWNQDRHYFTSQAGSEIFSYGLSKQQISERIREFNPHIVGITIDYTHQWGNARELADLVKTISEKTIVVMGGTHANGLPEDVLLDSPTDYVVLRQADRAFPELLDTLTGKTQTSLNDVSGIAYRQDGEVRFTNERKFLSRIDDIAVPDLSLVNLGLYSGPSHSAGQRMLDDGYLLYIFTSIGCNIRCTFCAIPPTQGPWIPVREQTLDSLLRYITGEGVREVLIEDDHLFHDPEWAMAVFRKLEEYKLPWVEEGGVAAFSLIALLPNVDENFIQSSVGPKEAYKFKEIIDAKRKGVTAEDLIRKMAASGCYSIYLAVESANSDALSTAHKPTLNTKEQLTGEIVEMLGKYGIRATGGLMLGFVNPDDSGNMYVEPRRQIHRTIEFGKYLRQRGLSYGNPFIFTPLPGAPHFKSLVFKLGSSLHRNTDEGFTHEFATIDAPNREWTRDELNLLRVHSILETNGIDGYRQILRTGTWPVKR